MANNLLDNLHYIKPYMERIAALQNHDSCLGCDHRVPLLENGLCADCESPGMMTEAFRKSPMGQKRIRENSNV